MLGGFSRFSLPTLSASSRAPRLATHAYPGNSVLSVCPRRLRAAGAMALSSLICAIVPCPYLDDASIREAVA